MGAGNAPSSGGPAGDALTRLRLILAAAGMTLALVGVLRDDRRIVWAAIAAVAAALALRLFQRPASPLDPP